MNKENLPNNRKAELHKDEYQRWKQESLLRFGFFPVFQTFKETSLLRNLSGNALKLYIYLGLMSGNYTGETWVSIDTMSSYFGKSRRTISSWIKELEEQKLIKRYQLKKDGVAHTFLVPYGSHKLHDDNSVQKGYKEKEPDNEPTIIIKDLEDIKKLFE